MSRQQFTARNNIGSVLTFQKSGSTSSFDPDISFSNGSRRVSWKLNNGSETIQTAGNSITYTGFTSDTGIRTIEMRGNSFRGITNLTLDDENLYGHINLSGLTNLGGQVYIFNNPNLTGITHSPSSVSFTNYWVYNCNIQGNLDLTPLSGLGGNFQIVNNPLLTGITHSPSPNNFTEYAVNNCNLTGNLDLTPLSGLGGNFVANTNPNLTGITHSPSPNNFTNYWAYSCNLTGNLDLTPLSGLSGVFYVYSNPNLTGITHVSSSQVFTDYYAHNCNLIGNLNLPFSGLGGDFRVNNNTNLTGITHSPSSEIFNTYFASNCNLTGNLDLTPLSGFGGSFLVETNANLTGITHTLSSNNVNQYLAGDCDLTGTIDLTPLTKLGLANSGTTGIIRFNGNNNLTNILLPTSTQFFKNASNTVGGKIFNLYDCDLGYVDFTPLSGATLLSGVTEGPAGIELQNNNMSATDVNHILVDFSGNTTYNPTGWSNVDLNIGGTNASPDSSSGGYDGLAAISFLTGSPYNWIITTS
jgi:hypothetical protein